MSIPNGLRRRLAAVATVAVASAGSTAVVVGATSASAAEHDYCVGCVIYNGTGIQDTTPFNLTLSYVHYLGAGDRYLAASAVGFNWVYGTNSASHSFSGQFTYATAGDFSGHDVTVNAHADY